MMVKSILIGGVLFGIAFYLRANHFMDALYFFACALSGLCGVFLAEVLE